jgi:hypothetical protein
VEAVVGPDKKKAPIKGPISLVVMVMMVVVMMMHHAGAGGGRRDNGQGEQSCEDVGE